MLHNCPRKHASIFLRIDNAGAGRERRGEWAETYFDVHLVDPAALFRIALVAL